MSEELLIKHCAPTLAAIKTGNMFSCGFENEEAERDFLRRLNGIFRNKGIRVIPLKSRGNKILIYVFRPAFLKKDMENEMTSDLMSELGYCCSSVEKCVAKLIKRLKESSDFPHEVGIFLGFPPEDVSGFISHNAKDCKMTGYWKVYGDEEKAKRTFAEYKRCSEIYSECFERGFTLEKLAVTEEYTNRP